MKHIFGILIFLTCNTLVFGQKTENLKVKVRIINAIDGSEVSNPKVLVKYSLSENVIPLKSIKRESFYEIVKGAEIKVFAEAFQFYSEVVHFETDRLFDNDILEVKLNPKPLGAVLISLEDAATKKAIVGKVSILSQDFHKENLDISAETEIGFERAGQFTFTAQAEGYEPTSIKINLKIASKPSEVEKVVIRLNRSKIVTKILVKDSENNKILNHVKITAVSNSTKEALPWNSEKMELMSVLEESILIQAEAPGYTPIEKVFKANGSPLEIFMSKTALAPFDISLTELNSKEKISGEIEVIAPSGKTETVAANTIYTPKENGEFTFILKKDGAGSYSQKQHTRSGQTALPVIFQLNTSGTVRVIVLDENTRQPINNANVTLIDEAENKVQGVNEKNTTAFKVKQNKEYFLSVNLPEYNDFNASIIVKDEKAQTENVLLSKKKRLEEHEYVVIDKWKKTLIKKNQLIIIDDQKRPLELTFNAAKGTYSTFQVDPNKKYTAQARADQYKSVEILLNHSAKEVMIELEPLQQNEYSLVFIEGYTKERLILDHLDVTASNGNPIKVSQLADEYSFSSSLDFPFTIRIKKAGYPDLEQIVSNSDNNRITVELKKEVYPFAIKIQNELTTTQKNSAKANIQYSTGQTIQNTFDLKDNSFIFSSNPAENLRVAIDMLGFKPFSILIDRNQSVRFNVAINLELIESSKESLVSEVKAQEIQPKQELPESNPKLSLGKTYSLTGVNFEQSRTDMLPGSENKLNEVLDFLQKNKNTSIQIIGHTDNTGDERQNQRLSAFRAKVVANWLFNHGIGTERITILGMGSKQPLTENNSPEAKAQNRRIEIMVQEEIR